MKIICLMKLLCFTLLFSQSLAQEKIVKDKTPVPDTKKIYGEIMSVVSRHYPKATSHHLKNKIHFEFDTRVYIIHNMPRVGDWGDPVETRAPKKGGILGDIKIRSGKYQGAAMAPHTFNRYYYSVMLMTPYFKEQDFHLHINLYIPNSGINKKFIQEFTELIDNLKYILK